MKEDKQEHCKRVFLCHAHEDASIAIKVYQHLRLAGHKPWLDKFDINPGEDWELSITKAVQNADFVLVFLSHHSVMKTGFVQREIRFALRKADEMPEGKIFIIPVRLEQLDSIPESLKRWQWFDLFKEDSYMQLAGVISGENSYKKPQPASLHGIDLTWAKDSIDNRVAEVISSTLATRLGTITPELSLAELGADEIDLCELAVRLEKIFGITIPDEESAVGWITVSDVVGTVRKQLELE
jgi:acyl carrier protein